jgi:putative ABC transport system permease protein
MNWFPTRADWQSARRALIRHRGFAIVAVLSLGIAIGLNTATFAIIDALLYPRFPFAEQSQLFRVQFTLPSVVVRQSQASFTEARARGLALVRQAPFYDGDASLVLTGAMPLEIEGSGTLSGRTAMASPNIFDLLGMKPEAGRLFSGRDRDLDREKIAVISFPLWNRLKTRQGGFDALHVTMRGHRYTVVGVMPDRAERALGADVIISDSSDFRGWLIRARPGYSRGQVEAQLAQVNAQFAREYGAAQTESRYDVDPVAGTAKSLRSFQIALLAAGLSVLLIACANLANLQLARGLSRSHELAIRAALGASRRELMRLLLAESMLIAISGGATGVLFATAGIAGLRHAIPATITGLGFVDPQLSWRVCAAAGAAVAIAVLLFGVLPSIRLTHSNLGSLLKSGTGARVTRRDAQYYKALTALEIAGCLALGIGAILLSEAARHLNTLDLGYEPQFVAMATDLNGVGPQLAFVGKGDPVAEFGGVISEIERQPDVVGAAVWREMRFDGNTLTIQNAAAAPSVVGMGDRRFGWVSADFFRTFGIQLLRGRGFQKQDDGAVPSVIVDSIAAAQWWRGSDPIGQMVKLGDASSDRPWVRVVGIIRHATFDIADDDNDPQIYYLGRLPKSSRPGSASTRVIVRTRTTPASLLASLRTRFADYPMFRVATLWEDASGLRTIRQSHQFIARVFVGFSLCGLVLALVGIHGVVSYSVAQRTHEFGVRWALGADARRIIGLVMREGALVTGLGVAGGLVLSMWAIGLIEFFLAGLTPASEVTVIVVAVVSVGVASTVAGLLPAIRAADATQLEALRGV